MLWITLCVTRLGKPETLALLGCGTVALFRGRVMTVNEINDLALICETTMLRRNSATRSFTQINFWG